MNNLNPPSSYPKTGMGASAPYPNTGAEQANKPAPVKADQVAARAALVRAAVAKAQAQAPAATATPAAKPITIKLDAAQVSTVKASPTVPAFPVLKAGSTMATVVPTTLALTPAQVADVKKQLGLPSNIGPDGYIINRNLVA